MSDELIGELNDAIKQLEGQIEQNKALGYEVHTQGFGLELFIKCRDYLKSQDGVRVSDELYTELLAFMNAVSVVSKNEALVMMAKSSMKKLTNAALSSAQEGEK